MKGHKGQVWTLAFDVDNVLASGSLDATIKLWNITTGQEVGALLGHLNCVWSVAVCNMLMMGVMPDPAAIATTFL